MPAMDEHSTLLQAFLNYVIKEFYNIDHWSVYNCVMILIYNFSHCGVYYKHVTIIDLALDRSIKRGDLRT